MATVLAVSLASNLRQHAGGTPASTEGLVLTFDSCGQSYTFRLDGHTAAYLVPRNGEGTQEQTSRGLFSDKDCSFGLSVSPSNEVEDTLFLKDPLSSALHLVLILALLGCLFCVYESLMARWQRRYTEIQTASQKVAPVELEELIQERTQTLLDSNQQLECQNAKLAASSAAQLTTFACASHEIRT